MAFSKPAIHCDATFMDGVDMSKLTLESPASQTTTTTCDTDQSSPLSLSDHEEKAHNDTSVAVTRYYDDREWLIRHPRIRKLAKIQKKHEKKMKRMREKHARELEAIRTPAIPQEKPLDFEEFQRREAERIQREYEANPNFLEDGDWMVDYLSGKWNDIEALVKECGRDSEIVRKVLQRKKYENEQLQLEIERELRQQENQDN